MNSLNRKEDIISRIRHGDSSYSHLYANIKNENANKIIGQFIYDTVSSNGYQDKKAQEKLRSLNIESFALYTKELLFVIDNGFYISKASL